MKALKKSNNNIFFEKKKLNIWETFFFWQKLNFILISTILRLFGFYFLKIVFHFYLICKTVFITLLTKLIFVFKFYFEFFFTFKSLIINILKFWI